MCGQGRPTYHPDSAVEVKIMASLAPFSAKGFAVISFVLANTASLASFGTQIGVMVAFAPSRKTTIAQGTIPALLVAILMTLQTATIAASDSSLFTTMSKLAAFLSQGTALTDRVISLAGVYFFPLAIDGLSHNRGAINCIPVSIVLQQVLALFILKSSAGFAIFAWFNTVAADFVTCAVQATAEIFYADTTAKGWFFVSGLGVIIFVASFVQMPYFHTRLDFPRIRSQGFRSPPSCSRPTLPAHLPWHAMERDLSLTSRTSSPLSPRRQPRRVTHFPYF
ncbi:hypothetical protein JB92DRAFT_831226 [Gautieria morchelliformis]|nr:hypothetical protein JB92DRAFT_831226 [Gautieria morchelliformis]